MSKIWRWVMILCGILLVLGLVLVGVSYGTGGSLERLLVTTDVADMTKFISREQLEAYLTLILG